MDGKRENLDRAVDAVNQLFVEMVAGKGDSANWDAYEAAWAAAVQAHGFTAETFRAGCRAVLDAFAQANTHGIRNT